MIAAFGSEERKFRLRHLNAATVYSNPQPHVGLLSFWLAHRPIENHWPRRVQFGAERIEARRLVILSNLQVNAMTFERINLPFLPQEEHDRVGGVWREARVTVSVFKTII